jgi:hypothetical protein
LGSKQAKPGDVEDEGEDAEEAKGYEGEDETKEASDQ